jgi:hypothetical protein
MLLSFRLSDWQTDLRTKSTPGQRGQMRMILPAIDAASHKQLAARHQQC